jgi:hypothetical protein
MMKVFRQISRSTISQKYLTSYRNVPLTNFARKNSIKQHDRAVAISENPGGRGAHSTGRG